MNLLAFDTSTEVLSVALTWRGRDGMAVREFHGEGGRTASATLIPVVMDLLHEAGLPLTALEAIVFGSGPGSFTGLRTACAVAQGLAWGAGLPVLGVPTLLAVAEEARHTQGHRQVLALLDARMDEVYAAAYDYDGQAWHLRGPMVLQRPEAVVVPQGFVMAGNAWTAYGPRLPVTGPPVLAQPTAAALLRLAPGLIAQGGALPADQAVPLYVRDKVAQTTQERQALRAAAGSTP